MRSNSQRSFDGMSFIKGVFLLILITLLIFGSTDLSDVAIIDTTVN